MAVITSFLTGVQERKFLGGQEVIVENKLDFSKTNVSGSDEVQALKIPVGAYVTDQGTEVVTAEGGAATGNFGDSDDPNGYDNAIDLNAAAFSATLRGTDAYAVGKHYSGGGTIDIVPSADLDTAVVYVWAKYFVAEKR